MRGVRSRAGREAGVPREVYQGGYIGREGTLHIHHLGYTRRYPAYTPPRVYHWVYNTGIPLGVQHGYTQGVTGCTYTRVYRVYMYHREACYTHREACYTHREVGRHIGRFLTVIGRFGRHIEGFLTYKEALGSLKKREETSAQRPPPSP